MASPKKMIWPPRVQRLVTAYNRDIHPELVLDNGSSLIQVLRSTDASDLRTVLSQNKLDTRKTFRVWLAVRKNLAMSKLLEAANTLDLEFDEFKISEEQRLGEEYLLALEQTKTVLRSVESLNALFSVRPLTHTIDGVEVTSVEGRLTLSVSDVLTLDRLFELFVVDGSMPMVWYRKTNYYLLRLIETGDVGEVSTYVKLDQRSYDFETKTQILDWIQELDDVNVILVKFKIPQGEYYSAILNIVDSELRLRYRVRTSTSAPVNDAKIVEILNRHLVPGTLITDSPVLSITSRETVGTKFKFDVRVPGLGLNAYSFFDFLVTDVRTRKFVAVGETGFPILTSSRKFIYLVFDNQHPTIRMSLQLSPEMLKVSVTDVPGPEYFSFVQEVMVRILSAYAGVKDQIEEEYRTYNVPQPDLSVASVSRVKTTLRTLKELVPEMFVYRYATFCQARQQPRIVSEAEIPELNERAQQVFKYPQLEDEPSTEKGYWFTCDHKEYPYIGLKVNKLENKARYSHLPCCFGKDQLNDPRSKLNRYLARLGDGKKAENAGRTLVSDRTLDFGKYGSLPTVLANLFDPLNDDPAKKFNRFGAETFLNAVLTAVDPRFAMIRLADDRWIRVNQAKENLVQTVPAYVCRQELWDLSETQITERFLRDEPEYNEYVRYVEVMYGISVFCFVRDGKDVLLDVPRHRPPYRVRKLEQTPRCLVLYKHKGIEGEKRDTYRYEIVVLYDEKTNLNQYLFPPDVTAIMSELLEKFAKSYFMENLSEVPRHLSQMPVYYSLSIPSDTKQYIDADGKTSALTFDGMTVMSSPLQPLVGVPVLDSVPMNDLETVLSRVSSATLNLDETNKVVGVKTDKFYFPVSPVSLDSRRSLSSFPQQHRKIYQAFGGLDDGSREMTKYREAYVLAAQLRFVFLVAAGKAIQSGMSLEKFLETRVVIRPDHRYLLSEANLRYRDPSSFVDSGVVTVPDVDVKVRLGYYYRQVAYSRSDLLTRLVINEYVENYIDPMYVSVVLGSSLFIGNDSVISWLITESSIQVFSTILLDLSLSTYLYVHEGRVFVIQQVNDGELGGAITVIDEWDARGQNVGYAADVSDRPLPYPKVEVSEKEKQPSLTVSSVIYYKELNKYAAALAVKIS